ncbi:DUF6185 family protein [Streptomyces sp. Ru87]|uniref:DUF6185 family protein n=1 Tax=Streptomyces sp. Ru87 TaxID=2044307 RepID=UPI000BF54CCC|nr:DUF6185 family protein [Streptomyces sp. Ru87]PGH47216.1 hypothetical protein CRI70_29650 [Streptomyces sp. Ru87]
MGSLHVAVAPGRLRAVLEQPLERSGGLLGAALHEGDRVKLPDRAWRYREVHALLRRLERGQSDDDAHSRRAFSLPTASVLGQFIALVTIWQFFVDRGGGPPQEIGIEHGEGPAGQSAGDQGAAGP